MAHLTVGDRAPDVSLPDHRGNLHTLSEIFARQNVLLVFNLGFAWLHCTNHMAQLRHDYLKFSDLNTQVMVMVPNGPKMIEKYVANNAMPYPILTDKNGLTAAQYGITIRNTIMPGMCQLFKPSVFLVAQGGIIRYSNYLKSYIQEPDNREPLAVLTTPVGWGVSDF